MLSEILAFVALINPFALFLYLDSVRRDLSFAKFTYVIFKASVISFAVSILFFIAGDYILREIFNINFNSFRIFGVIVIFTSAYLFVVKGGGALIHYKDDLDDLASDIALPFMVGAGTISLSILYFIVYLIGFSS
jgi:multiple antibiotic resistance protein